MWIFTPCLLQMKETEPEHLNLLLPPAGHWFTALSETLHLITWSIKKNTFKYMYRIYTNNMPHIQNWHEFLSDVFHSTTCREFVLKKRKKQRLSGAAVYFPVCVTVQTSVVPTVTHGCWLFPFQSFWFFLFQPGFVNTTEVSLLKVFKSQVGTFPFRWGMGGVGGAIMWQTISVRVLFTTDFSLSDDRPRLRNHLLTLSRPITFLYF